MTKHTLPRPGRRTAPSLLRRSHLSKRTRPEVARLGQRLVTTRISLPKPHQYGLLHTLPRTKTRTSVTELNLERHRLTRPGRFGNRRLLIQRPSNGVVGRLAGSVATAVFRRTTQPGSISGVERQLVLDPFPVGSERSRSLVHYNGLRQSLDPQPGNCTRLSMNTEACTRTRNRRSRSSIPSTPSRLRHQFSTPSPMDPIRHLPRRSSDRHSSLGTTGMRCSSS